MPRDSIVAQLNIDMVGRGGLNDITGVTKAGAQIHGGPGYVQLIGSRRLSTELGDIAEKVNTEQASVSTSTTRSMQWSSAEHLLSQRSLHVRALRHPDHFFTTGGHADYHQVTDEPQYIDYNRMERVGKLVYGIADPWGTSTTGSWWISRSPTHAAGVSSSGRRTTGDEGWATDDWRRTRKDDRRRGTEASIGTTAIPRLRAFGAALGMTALGSSLSR